MKLKLTASIKKEFLLLIRDMAGLSMLFIMPIALVILMALLQDSTFKVLDEKKMPVVIINNDNDIFGNNIVSGLSSSKFFDVTVLTTGDATELRKEVASGQYMIGIIVLSHATQSIQKNLNKDIYQQFPEEITGSISLDTLHAGISAKVDVFFDPVLKNSFKQSVLSALREYSSGVEAQIVYKTYANLFKELLGVDMKKPEKRTRLVEFNEQLAAPLTEAAIPNSTQHNVPAWTLFAMFFIVIPLSSSMISERESGVILRLKTMPGSTLPSLLGKVTVYFTIGLLQALLMLLIGEHLFPLLDLPELNIGNQWLSLLLLTVLVSATASGYGILIGSVASSQKQASVFGSISVVIMAAMGGIWVPVFMMTDLMKTISKLSPLNWALDGYSSILLRHSGIDGILTDVLLLSGFFMASLAGAWFYSKHHDGKL
ncbi:MAG: hypothetical protein DRJ09_12495 [Bacteroidetes bacterium]|nr:MAG: hypothetical protein DRJ09_12495 [Bacteroidota bacterium]